MRRLIIALFFLLVFPLYLFAGWYYGGGLSCTTADDTEQWAPTGQTTDTTAVETWNAQKITVAATTMVTMYKLAGCEGSQVGTLDVMLMNHDAVNDYPDETSIVPSSTKSLGHADIADCYPATVEHDFELATPITISAGTYWAVSKEISGFDQRISKDTTSSGDRYCYSNNSGSTWSCTDNYSMWAELWGCS